jgi:hypothetical protein
MRSCSSRVALTQRGAGLLNRQGTKLLMDFERRQHPNYYEFTTVVRFEAFRPERRSRRNLMKLKKVMVVPAGGIEPTA